MQILKTQRGADMIVYEGNLFIFRSSFGPFNRTPRKFIRKLISEEEVVRQRWIRVQNGERLIRNNRHLIIGRRLIEYINSLEDTEVERYLLNLVNFIY